MTLRVCLGRDGERCPNLTDRSYCAIHRTREARGRGPRYEANRLLALERDGWRCRYCGGRASTADHVIPIVEGGTDELDNLVAACSSCNRGKGSGEGRVKSLHGGLGA